MDYTTLGKDVISQQMPSGSNARFDDEFEQLQTEIDKLSSPVAREEFDWDKVADYASIILKEQSKDILVASYLCVSLIHIQGGEGLEQGVKIYDDLLHNFWDTLFPPLKRVAGRISALTWWLGQTNQALETVPNLKISSRVEEAVVDRLENIERFFEKHPDLDLSAKRLIQRIKQMSEGRTASEKPDVSASLPPKQTAPEPRGAADLNTQDPDKSAQMLFRELRQVCVRLREQNPENPQPYQWLRFSLWSLVNGLPPAVDLKTRIAPPVPKIKIHLAALFGNQDWQGIVSAAESGLNNPKHIFFLDLNRYCAQALLNMGPKYQAAHDAVCQQTELFTRRFKGIEELTFSDGTAFADEETRQWLARIKPSGGNDAVPKFCTIDAELDRETTKVIKSFRQMAAEKDGLFQAIGFLDRNLANNRSPKVELLYKTELARMLVAQKKEKVAIPHLTRMLDLIRKYRADIWEPGVSLEALKLTHQVLNKQSDDSLKKQSNEAFCMAAGISTVAAMGL